jgi:hypothetical protein
MITFRFDMRQSEPKATVPDLFSLTALEVLRLVSSKSRDASEFGTRFVLYMTWVTKNNRNKEEQEFMQALHKALLDTYAKQSFRQHLFKVLQQPIE